MSGNFTPEQLDNMTLDQLQGMKQQYQQSVQTQGDLQSSLDGMTLDQLNALKQSHANVLAATGTQDASNGQIVPNNAKQGLNTNTAENLYLGYGSALNDFVLDPAKDLYDQMFGSSDQVKADKASQESERAQYANTPAGQSAAGEFARIGTGIGLATAVGGVLAPEAGAGLGVSLAGNAAVNAGMGAFEADPGNRTASALGSAAIGGVLQGGANLLGKTAASLGQDILNNPNASNAVTLGQATGSPLLAKVEDTLSNLPLPFGVRSALTKQVQGTQAMVDNFKAQAAQYPKDNLGADLSKSFVNQFTNVKTQNDANFLSTNAKISSTPAGSAPDLDAVKQVITTKVIPNLQSFPTDIKQQGMDIAKSILNANPTNFAEAYNKLQLELKPAISSVPPALAKVLSPIKSAFQANLQKIANDASPQLGKEYMNNFDFWKNNVQPFEQISFLKSAVNSNKPGVVTPGNFFKQMLDSNPIENIKPIISSLDSDGKIAAKYGIMQHAIDLATNKTGINAGSVDLNKFMTNYQQYSKSLGLLQDAKSTQTMQGLTNALQMVTKNPRMYTKANSWQDVAKGVGGAVAGAAGITYLDKENATGNVGSLAVATGLLSSLLAWKGGIQSLRAIGKYSLSDPKLPGVVRDLVTRLAQVSALNASKGTTQSQGPAQPLPDFKQFNQPDTNTSEAAQNSQATPSSSISYQQYNQQFGDGRT